jgi:DNA-binding transcriptional MerR regulator
MEKILSTRNVSDIIGVQPSTIRKYVLILEEKGYVFIKNERSQRLYTQYDVTYLRQFKQLLDAKGMTLDDAAKLVSERFLEAGHDRIVTHGTHDNSDMSPDNNSDVEGKIDQLLEIVKRQDEKLEAQERFNRELLARLEDQQKYINEAINKRDQTLLMAIREVQETKGLIAAEEEKSKGFFSKLFGRK